MSINRFLLLFFLLHASLMAQQIGLPVDGWREHLPMNECLSVADAGDVVYCATELGIIVLRKDDNSVDLLGKSDGLSDLMPTAIAWHKPSATLVIGYRTGNIDLLKDRQIYNLGDIVRSNIILGNKAINKIRFKGSNAYLCTSFGVVELNIERREINSTFFPTENNADVFDIAFRNDSAYVATEIGVRAASLNNPAIVYFGSWSPLPLLASNGPTNSLAWFNNELYISRIRPFEFARDTLLKWVPGIGSTIVRTDNNFFNLRESRNQLLVCQNNSILFKAPADTGFSLIFTYNTNTLPNPADAVVDEQESDVIWIADNGQGLIRAFRIFGINVFLPEGPASKNVFRLKHNNSQLWVATGSYDLAFSPLYFIDGVMTRRGPDWDSYRFPQGNDWVRDMVSVAVDPTDPEHVFAPTWGRGLAEIRNGELVEIYDTTNSSLRGISTTSAEVRLSDAAYDKEGRLWIANASSTRPIAMRKPDGTWRSYSFNSSVNGRNTGDILVDSLNQIWMIVQDRGLVVMQVDENNDLAGFKLVTDQAGSGALNQLKVYSMAVDRDGLVWVGTGKGVNVFYSPESIFAEGNQNWDGQKIVVSQTDFNQYLLASEEVTAIAVDGANRKWFGTRNAGVFLVSPDGTEQIRNFNETNSPLLSNTITSISIDQKSGEVFFGTDQGICSYRSDANAGDDTFGKVYAFPNPVGPDYNGLVTVTGLVTDADVKITDVQGNVVFSGRANGGMLTWNGRLFSGERAATGVYLIFCSNDDGSQTKVAKLLFIN